MLLLPRLANLAMYLVHEVSKEARTDSGWAASDLLPLYSSVQTSRLPHNLSYQRRSPADLVN